MRISSKKITIQTVFSSNANGNITLHNNFQLQHDNETWGGTICDKSDDEFRLVLKQIGGMGVSAGNAKELELKEWLSQLKADCCGLVETNVYWGNVVTRLDSMRE